ncbi:hypothetical protein [Haloarcula halophila]|uniref:hypothetical protein n=1 Tax=Haloarcula TaxID=2237 RepID=UPI0023E3CFEB|nr:hypothetical protein [Halomicroarcula sp. DFY41]
MNVPSVNCVSNTHSVIFGGNKHEVADGGDMPPEARRELVLEFIAEKNIPLPPLAIWAGLNREHRVTFSYRTMQNILSDLVEDGDLFKVDTGNLRDGEITEISGDSSSRRAYYFITDKGLERIADATND